MNVAEFESKRNEIIQGIRDLLKDTEFASNTRTMTRQARITGLKQASEYKQYEALASLDALEEALDAYDFNMRVFAHTMEDEGIRNDC
jgi:uncharacterized protein (UPF0147 family)